MIIHKLISHHLKHKDDPEFYVMQARDAVQWIVGNGVPLGPGCAAIDLGCGHGILGGELKKRCCEVTFADEGNYLHEEFRSAPFVQINIDNDTLDSVGTYDLVVCSNVLEHLRYPKQFLERAHRMLNPGGHLYLSWTNWLSPWGGHEFSPFHYLGYRRGQRIWKSVTGKKPNHEPFENLFPTYIGTVLKWIRSLPGMRLKAVVPRYYPEFALICSIPGLREFLTWNCAILLQHQPATNNRSD